METLRSLAERFVWHSSLGIDSVLAGAKKPISKLERTAANMRMFIKAGNDLLIHKTTKALWRVSEDGKSIEPVFENDVLSDEDIMEVY